MARLVMIETVKTIKHVVLQIMLVCFVSALVMAALVAVIKEPQTQAVNIGRSYDGKCYMWIGKSYGEDVTMSMEYYVSRAAYLREQAEIEKKAKQAKKNKAAAVPPVVVEVIPPPEGVSGEYIGQFRISHYTDAPDENGGYTCTAIGTPIIPGQTAAMKSGYLPYGTKIYIVGVGYRIVEDCGVGSGKIDVAVATKEEAFEKGIFYADVWIVG